jgi:hypothetical protein
MEREASETTNRDRGAVIVPAHSMPWRPGRWRRLLPAVIVVLMAIVGTREKAPTTPAPHISALVPRSVVQGSDDLVLNVAGEHFLPGASVVLWNGGARPTRTFQGSLTLLVVTIFKADLSVPGTATVTVTVIDSDRRRSSLPVTFDVLPAATWSATAHCAPGSASNGKAQGEFDVCTTPASSRNRVSRAAGCRRGTCRHNSIAERCAAVRVTANDVG